MIRRPPLVAILAVTALPAFAGPAADAVRFFYVPVQWEADPEYRDRFTGKAKELFDLNDKAPKGEIGCIDFGPGIDAQDFDDATVEKTLELTEEVEGDTATVTASFYLFPDHSAEGKREVQWSLVNEGGAWKIADIASPLNGWRLSELECQLQN